VAVVLQELGVPELEVSEGLVVAVSVVVEFEVFEGIFLLLPAVLDIFLLAVLDIILQRVFLPMANLHLVADIVRLVADIVHLVADIELQEIHLLPEILQELPIAFELECPIGFVFVPIVVELDVPIVSV
jgi:hypothetical protein